MITRETACEMGGVLPEHVRGMNEAEEAAERERFNGNKQFKFGNYCAAIKYYNMSLHLDPDVAATYANRALCHLKMKDWNSAKADCTEALKLDASYVKAVYRRALAFEGLGDLRGALKDLQVASKVLPDDAELLEKLKVIKRKLRVTFVKEVRKEEAENQKKLSKLEEDSKNPHQLHKPASRLEFRKGHPFETSEDRNKQISVPVRTKNFRFTRTTRILEKLNVLESPRPLLRT